MRHEVIASALKAFHLENLFGHVKPLRRVHSYFDEAFFRDLVRFDSLGKIPGSFRSKRITYFEQMAHALLLAVPAGVRVIGISVQGIFPQSKQYLHESRNTLYTGDSRDCY